jgi:hypothetical protein
MNDATRDPRTFGQPFERVTFTLPRADRDALADYAARLGICRSEAIRRALHDAGVAGQAAE